MELTISTPFVFYVDGINPTQFENGLQDVPEEAAAYALSAGFVSLENDAQPTKEPPKRGKK